MKRTSLLAGGLFAWLAFVPDLALAGTNGFIVPFFRGTPGSQAGYWESFNTPVGDPGNVPDRPGSTSTALFVQSQTNAFLTGSGNIYNLDGASRFMLKDATPFKLGAVIIQVRSIGGEFDYASPVLTCSNAAGLHVVPPQPRVELNRTSVPGLGTSVSTFWQWDVSTLGITAYEVTFAAAGPSLSFDSLTLDTWEQFSPLFSAPFTVNSPTPVLERWLYPHNAAPCDRAAGSSFATFGDAPGVDTRHAQHLLGWDTAAVVPAQRGATNYLITRCRITLTVNRGNLFNYDPTPDRLETHLESGQSGALPDDDVGRPVELFGVGFRNGFNAATFDQCAPFGSSAVAERNAYAVSWATNGLWVDVSNHVGKTNAAFPSFEAVPFAIGQTTDVAPGELVPAATKLVFDLNLADPWVLGYLRDGLDAGRLRFMVSSLHTSSGPNGPASYPDFATRFNAALVEPTRLEIEGGVVGSGDLDADGLPDDWELFQLGGLSHGATEDPDADGASNLAEWQAGTQPAVGDDVLRITVGASARQGPTLRWAHQANRGYQLEFTEDWLIWEPITSPRLVYSQSGTVEWVKGLVSGESGLPRFYRVRVTQP